MYLNQPFITSQLIEFSFLALIIQVMPEIPRLKVIPKLYSNMFVDWNPDKLVQILTRPIPFSSSAFLVSLFHLPHAKALWDSFFWT